MSPTPEKLPQRLVLFLDGTWNNKDDCTNVLNIFNLVVEGVVGEGASRRVQRKYYDEGVGTGVLDSMSGGIFGTGLEENVREAYNWLVANFNDSGDKENYQADEIFIFGFSRGAYTARSLAGFLARCGLLERGSPLTVSQLWQGYGQLEREKQEEDLVLDRLLSRKSFHQLEQLKSDPWPGAENKTLIDRQEFTPTDELLAIWSRRVRITFIGIFDTVGALGIDALGIPGVRGKLGRIHNLRPSSSYLNVCHALAIDENRNSFQHTPLVEYLPHGQEDRAPRKSLQQVWFVGAHANVGGGYPNNTLAQIPLSWMLQEAAKIGLVHHASIGEARLPSAELLPAPNDSFVAFSGIFGPSFLRQKRNFRTLAPERELRAKRGEVEKSWSLADAGTFAPGFSLFSNEVVHPTVWQYAAAHPQYGPPQLIRHASELCDRGQADPVHEQVAKRPLSHDWPDLPSGGSAVLVFWALVAGLGFLVLDGVFQLFPGALGDRNWVAAGVVALVAVLADWGESRLNLRLALGHRPEWEKAVFSALFWVRAFLVICFIAGISGSIGVLLAVGWNSRIGQPTDPWETVRNLLGEQGWYLPLVAFAAVAAAKLFDRVLGAPTAAKPQPRKDLRARIQRGLNWLVGMAGVAALAVLAGRLAVRILTQAGIEVKRMPALGDHFVSQSAEFAGRYLFLLVLLGICLRAFVWVSLPMTRANLGRLTFLMLKGRARIRQGFERLEKLLARPGGQAEARLAIRSAVGESLWRDILVLIPLYTFTLGFALKTAASWPGDARLAAETAGRPLWFWIVLAIGVADLLESVLHLGYLGKTGPFAAPGFFAVAVANTATAIKFGLLVPVALICFATVLAGGFSILWINEGQWRGAVVSVIMIAAMAAVASVVLVNVRAFLARRVA